MRSGNIKREKSEFEPSKKLLPRIMQVLLENNSLNRTALAQAANLNYATLCRYVMWLNQKSLVAFAIVDDKFTVTLTEAGRDLALKLASMPY
ncbi:MAG: winged helix-turn-helix domain-containing protein [Candidatus Nitrosotenuis sp.]